MIILLLHAFPEDDAAAAAADRIFPCGAGHACWGCDFDLHTLSSSGDEYEVCGIDFFLRCTVDAGKKDARRRRRVVLWYSRRRGADDKRRELGRGRSAVRACVFWVAGFFTVLFPG